MWSWESFFGTMIGCVIGWTVVPDVARWIKGKGGVEGSPDQQESISSNDEKKDTDEGR